jgi:hypothetical protein
MKNAKVPLENLPGVDNDYTRASSIWMRALKSANRVKYNKAKQRAENALETMRGLIDKMNSK